MALNFSMRFGGTLALKLDIALNTNGAHRCFVGSPSCFSHLRRGGEIPVQSSRVHETSCTEGKVSMGLTSLRMLRASLFLSSCTVASPEILHRGYPTSQSLTWRPILSPPGVHPP